jgi:hypothetical protein
MYHPTIRVLIVLETRFRQEWEAELEHREAQLVDGPARLGSQN